MSRIDEAKSLLELAKSASAREDYTSEIQICDKLLAGYSDLISIPAIKSSRAAALCKIGRFSEAKPIFEEILHSHMRSGLSIASTRAMYWWLLCRHGGDERKAMDAFVVLDETKALALLNEQKEVKKIEIEASTLEEARSQVNSKMPDGFFLISERILSDGKSLSVKGVAESIDSAFSEAQSNIVQDARIISRKTIQEPKPNIIRVAADSVLLARDQVNKQIDKSTSIKNVKLIVPGRKGFLGIGKRQNQYDVEILKQFCPAKKQK